MRPEDVHEFLHRKPFRPFRITLTDGRTYEVRHPELAMVGRSSLVIGFPAPGDPEPIYDRTVWVSLMHIMQMEPSEAQGTLPTVGPEPVTQAVIIEETNDRPRLSPALILVLCAATKFNVKVLDQKVKDRDGNNPPKGLEGFWGAVGTPLPQLVVRRGANKYESQPCPQTVEQLQKALR